MSTQNTNKNFKKISICLFTLAVIGTTILLASNFITPQRAKFANASGPNTSNLIIGTNETNSAIELSVCVQATPGPIHLANVSTWFQFNTAALNPTANTFIQKGQYGNGNNGYGVLKWQQVAGTQNGTSDTYTMSLVYSGDGVTPGLAGLPMTTTPELFGKVNFAKVSGSTASTGINLVKNIFYSTETPSTAISQTVSYVSGDCLTSTTVITQSSSSTVSSNTNSIATNSSSSTSSSQNISSSVATVSSVNAVTITITPNTQVPNITIPVTLTVPSLPNNVSAVFKFPGSNVSILGMIQNNIFVPNVGQLVPNDVLTFYGANSFGNGFLTVGLQTFTIPTNVVNSSFIPATGGGAITPSNASGSITISLDNKSTQRSLSSLSPITAQIQTNLESKANGVFKSKLSITDPYICGVGSYGNVPNAKEFGVEAVYYDFYKEGSTNSVYSFKLKLNTAGDFFLPISRNTNLIAEGKYRVVFYALDNEGNKAQGEFTDFITDNCSDIQNNINPNSVRTGGSQYMIVTFSMISVLVLALATAKLHNKKYSTSYIFGKK
jgi:hypothetical protein